MIDLKLVINSTGENFAIGGFLKTGPRERGIPQEILFYCLSEIPKKTGKQKPLEGRGYDLRISFLNL